MFCYVLDIFLDILFLIIWRPRAIPLGSPWKLTGPPEALGGPWELMSLSEALQWPIRKNGSTRMNPWGILGNSSAPPGDPWAYAARAYFFRSTLHKLYTLPESHGRREETIIDTKTLMP